MLFIRWVLAGVNYFNAGVNKWIGGDAAAEDGDCLYLNWLEFNWLDDRRSHDLDDEDCIEFE